MTIDAIGENWIKWITWMKWVKRWFFGFLPQLKNVVLEICSLQNLLTGWHIFLIFARLFFQRSAKLLVLKTNVDNAINYYLAVSIHEKNSPLLLKCGLFMAVFKEIPAHNNPIEFYRIFAEYFQWGIAVEFQNGKIGWISESQF